MPRTQVVFFKDDDGAVPFLDWLDSLDAKSRDKCVVKIERLAELGHELRRPEADFLVNGIYELRVKRGRVQYRILYFYHGDIAAVVSHGLAKEDAVPLQDIKKAIERKNKFVGNPGNYTMEWKN